MYIMFIHVCTHMYMAISYIFKYECVRTYVYMCVYVCTYIDVCVYITGLGRGQAHHAAQGTEQRPPRHDRYHRVCVSVCLCVCFSLSLSVCLSQSMCISVSNCLLVCVRAYLCWCVLHGYSSWCMREHVCRYAFNEAATKIPVFNSGS